MGAKLLENLIFAQGRRCFFCDKHLPAQKASVEHLLATSKGGTNTDDNRVACCQTFNGILGNKSLKEKFSIVLRQPGKFCCPEDTRATTPVATPSADPAFERVLRLLRQQHKARPARLSSLTTTVTSWLKDCPQSSADDVIRRLQEARKVVIQHNKVTYSL